jgi:hypothetical protein
MMAAFGQARLYRLTRCAQTTVCRRSRCPTCRRRPLMGPAELIFLVAIGAAALILIMTA